MLATKVQDNLVLCLMGNPRQSSLGSRKRVPTSSTTLGGYELGSMEPADMIYLAVSKVGVTYCVFTMHASIFQAFIGMEVYCDQYFYMW